MALPQNNVLMGLALGLRAGFAYSMVHWQNRGKEKNQTRVRTLRSQMFIINTSMWWYVNAEENSSLERFTGSETEGYKSHMYLLDFHSSSPKAD